MNMCMQFNAIVSVYIAKVSSQKKEKQQEIGF